MTSSHTRPVKGMWLTNVQFLGGCVTEGKAYQVTSGAGENNPAVCPFPGSDSVNDPEEFSFVDDEGTERYSATDPNLFLDEWRLSTPEEIENAKNG